MNFSFPKIFLGIIKDHFLDFISLLLLFMITALYFKVKFDFPLK